MAESYQAEPLPLKAGSIDPLFFLEELIDAISKLEVYKAKIRDSKLDSAWFMPTLQQKEALASSALEGTHATLDEVLTNQVVPNDKDQNVNEVGNYYRATYTGYAALQKRGFSDAFFFDMHEILMKGNVRKPSVVGAYRTGQNCIRRNDSSRSISFVPPIPEQVPSLMDNLIKYMNDPSDKLRPLVRAAIVHAQFESIHPFEDGNGRVGRLLIPMYLFAEKQIDSPCFFVSEALERDKNRYYTLLNNIRFKGEWNEWVKFFLCTVAAQCDKYIDVICRINTLYERDCAIACEMANSSNMVNLISALFKQPITTGKELTDITQIPVASVNRYLNLLVEKGILFSDGKQRNRTFYYYNLLDILR